MQDDKMKKIKNDVESNLIKDQEKIEKELKMKEQ